MNERIRELLNEATSGLEPDISPQRTVTLNEMEKFAELIVRECIAKAEEESERYLTWNTEDCNRFSKVMQNYKELLKEHFGVEE